MNSDTEKGLYNKYRVERRDGSSGPGGKHEHCEYFVLDMVHDAYAIPALTAYATSCQKDYPQLAADLRTRWGLPPAATQTGHRWSKAQAEAAGYTVDTHAYPWIAYKGARFNPSEHFAVMTDREAALEEALTAAMATRTVQPAAHGTCFTEELRTVLTNIQTELRATGRDSARIERLINCVPAVGDTLGWFDKGVEEGSRPPEGMEWVPAVFVQKAQAAGHPDAHPRAVPQLIAEALDALAEARRPAAIAKGEKG